MPKSYNFGLDGDIDGYTPRRAQRGRSVSGDVIKANQLLLYLSRILISFWGTLFLIKNLNHQITPINIPVNITRKIRLNII